MASIAEVFDHLIRYAPGLSDERRQEFIDAVYSEPGITVDRAAGEPPASVRIAALKEELAAAEKLAAAGG